jgi:hypothetical protein
MSDKISKGVYVEVDESFVAQRVVEGSAPERGYVLIAPGTTVTPDDEARVKRTREELTSRASTKTVAGAAAGEPQPVQAPARSTRSS